MVVCHIIESSVAPESADGSDEVNLRGSLPAGVPIIFQLLEMPPQAKSINNWTIRKGIMLVHTWKRVVIPACHIVLRAPEIVSHFQM